VEILLIIRIPTLFVYISQVCAYESMQAGVYHLKRIGVSRLTQTTGLSAAMNKLPDEALVLAAASHIERELQITPWNLSSNFVSANMQASPVK
jgi:transcription initiation factor TFIID subunit 1